MQLGRMLIKTVKLFKSNVQSAPLLHKHRFSRNLAHSCVFLVHNLDSVQAFQLT